MTIVITHQEELCMNCKHFHQHYRDAYNRNGELIGVHCGHCVYPRVKHRKPTDRCDKWESKFIERSAGG